MTLHFSLELPDEPLPGELPKDAEGVARELLLAALVKWYECGMVSSGWAAKAADLSRGEFLDALARYSVSPFQYSPEELLEDGRRAKNLHSYFVPLHTASVSHASR
jgi:predicted HTH domain antitoxin